MGAPCVPETGNPTLARPSSDKHVSVVLGTNLPYGVFLFPESDVFRFLSSGVCLLIEKTRKSCFSWQPGFPGEGSRTPGAWPSWP